MKENIIVVETSEDETIFINNHEDEIVILYYKKDQYLGMSIINKIKNLLSEGD